MLVSKMNLSAKVRYKRFCE